MADAQSTAVEGQAKEQADRIMRVMREQERKIDEASHRTNDLVSQLESIKKEMGDGIMHVGTGVGELHGVIRELKDQAMKLEVDFAGLENDDFDWVGWRHGTRFVRRVMFDESFESVPRIAVGFSVIEFYEGVRLIRVRPVNLRPDGFSLVIDISPEISVSLDEVFRGTIEERKPPNVMAYWIAFGT